MSQFLFRGRRDLPTRLVSASGYLQERRDQITRGVRYPNLDLFGGFGSHFLSPCRVDRLGNKGTTPMTPIVRYREVPHVSHLPFLLHHPCRNVFYPLVTDTFVCSKRSDVSFGSLRKVNIHNTGTLLRSRGSPERD